MGRLTVGRLMVLVLLLGLGMAALVEITWMQYGFCEETDLARKLYDHANKEYEYRKIIAERESQGATTAPWDKELEAFSTQA